MRFDGDRPQEIRSRVDIEGLRRGESLVAIDFRPANGRLYAIGSSSQLYVINIGRGTANPVGDRFTPRLRGTRFGMDFNPTVDAIRLVSNADQNLRISPSDGQVAFVDGDLAYAEGDRNAGKDPSVVVAAYRNSTPAAFGGTNTELYDIDSGLDIMVEQDPPNDGTLLTEGRLGVDTSGIVGFDIVTLGASPAGDRGYAAPDPAGEQRSKFYKVNLNTGEATLIGRIGGGLTVEGLAIPIGQR